MIKSEGEKPMFCYNCGQQLSEDNYCSRCKITVPPLNQELAMKSIQNLSATQSNTNLSAKPLPEETPQSLFEKGKRCEASGNSFGAIKYYREGVKAGSIESAEALLEVYTSGKYNVHPNNQELVDLLEKLASVNSPIALFKLAIINLKSPHIVGLNAPDYKTATSLLERAAILNDPMAAFVLGEIYFYGSKFSQYTENVKTFGLTPNGLNQVKDEEKAQYWYKIASDNGIGAASNMLGVQLILRHTNLRILDAIYFFEKGANQGSRAAMVNIGIAKLQYQPGGGSSQSRMENNVQSAAYWFNRAAEAGFVEGMVCLAILYTFESNRKYQLFKPDIAYQWLCHAADEGDMRASQLKIIMDSGVKDTLTDRGVDGVDICRIYCPYARDIW